MKKLISLLLVVIMVCCMSMAAFAATVNFGTGDGEVELSLFATGNQYMSVEGGTVSVSGMTPSENPVMGGNVAAYNANASIKKGFSIHITDIIWDETVSNGILIYVSPNANGSVLNLSPTGVALYVSKTGAAYMYSNVKNGLNPDAHPFGKWTDMFAEKADALAAGSTSFYYSILPLDDPESPSQYGVYVTANAPTAGTDTPMYTFNTTATQAYDGSWFTAENSNTLFKAAAADTLFNFSFQILADGALSWGNGISTVPSAGSLSYTVDSIVLPSVIAEEDPDPVDPPAGSETEETKDVYATFVSGDLGGDVYSVNITWGTFEFQYIESDKTWDPDNLQYVDEVTSGWVENDAGTITVENRSNTAVDVTFCFEAEEAYNTVIGEFYVNAVKAEDAVRLASAVGSTGTGPSVVATFKPDGTLSNTVTTKTVIGTITVTIEAVTD